MKYIKSFLFLIYIIFSPYFLVFTNDTILEDTFSNGEGSDYLIIQDETKAKSLVEGDFFTNSSQLMLKIAVGLGVGVVIYGGIRFMLSFGEEGEMKKARNSLLISILGFLIAFGSYYILSLMQSIPNTFK